MSKFDLAEHMERQMMGTAPAPRDIEIITAEILDLKQKAGSAILGIGQRLVEAKELLDHGEWLTWLAERAEFSERQAQRFMKLAREWSNPTTLSDLGASKALVLLALPPEERERFVEENNVIDMSARELSAAIKARDEALKQAELAEAGKKAAEDARTQMAADMKVANNRLAALRQELDELKNRPIDVAVESASDEELAQARKEAEAAIKEKLAAEQERAAELEKQLKLAGSKEMAAFAVHFETIQADFNRLFVCLAKIDSAEDHDKLVDALEALLRAVGERLPKKGGGRNAPSGA